MRRIPSIDIARGLVMVIMALDHTRDLIHDDSLLHNPLDLTTTKPLLFFTRWITHLCAPSFVFLSGTSVWLSSRNNPDPKAVRNFLLSRGLWLIILEVTLVSFAVWFDIRCRIIMLQVIAVIGFGFIALAFLHRLSPKTLGVIGLVILFSHDLLFLTPAPQNTVLLFLRSLFLITNMFQVTPNFALLIAYPIIPWFGIMLLGYSAGRIFLQPDNIQKRLLLRIGIAALLLLLILRLPNLYGDRAPWSPQRTPVFTFLSFMNVSKQPPSLQFTLLMLGILLLFLAAITGKDSAIFRILNVYGKVPLFYYLLHWYAIRCILFIVLFAQGYHVSDMNFSPFQFGRPPGSGLPLGAVYAIWIAIVVSLYPACRWYGRYKAAHRENKWLRYL